MPLLASDALQRIRSGQLTLGLGVHHLRGAAVPLLAKAAGFDFLFIDAEHGAISTPEISQIAIAALGMGVVPIVRICAGALDEGTRALDNGALGLVVPHVDTPEEAQQLVEAFRFAPMGHRSTGGSNAAFGYRPPPTAATQQAILNSELLIIPMIETPRAVENADAIAAIPGIDALLIGSNDLALEMGIPGQLGHDSIRQAYETVGTACRSHNKVLGMGGIYDEALARRYIGLGARLVLGANDHSLILNAATQRAAFLRGIPLEGM
jgi:2-keto-3-deoxy-L-rhamnonate aldolase RhmA